MTDELTPVRCGCGGEAKVDWALQPDGVYIAGVYCENCGTKTIPFWSKEKDKAIDYAVTTWNRAMSGSTEKSSTVERTAKVKKHFMLATGGMGDTLPLCECGFIVSDKWTYCPECGCRLEWK